MDNILFIQGENRKIGEYVFKNDSLQEKKDLPSIDLIKILTKKFGDFDIYENKNLNISIFKKIPSGFVITGILNNTDDQGRKMTFSLFYKDKKEDLPAYLNNCLSKINKSVSEESISDALKIIRKYNLIRDGAFLIIFVTILFVFLKSL